MGKPEQYTDEELVRGCVNNDRFCQEMLFRKYFPAMMRMCMRYANDQDTAMEIVNIGFLRVFKKLHTFSFAGSLEGWIRKLVFHSLSDYYRKQSRTIHLLDIEDRDAPQRAKALDNLYWDDITRLVDHLPEATRRVFWLYAVEGYTHPEISEKIGISVGTSKWHLAMARQKLKELIKDYYYNSRNHAG